MYKRVCECRVDKEVNRDHVCRCDNGLGLRISVRTKEEEGVKGIGYRL